MQIRVDDPTAPYVTDLLAHHLRELQGAMDGHAFALDATGLAVPSVTFWTAWQDDALLGFGALKELDGSHGEVKSMRAAPAARGKGVGRALLDHIIAEARTRGYSRLSLETGTAALHVPAVALYRSAGFVQSDPFADYQQASIINSSVSIWPASRLNRREGESLLTWDRVSGMSEMGREAERPLSGQIST